MFRKVLEMKLGLLGVFKSQDFLVLDFIMMFVKKRIPIYLLYTVSTHDFNSATFVLLCYNVHAKTLNLLWHKIFEKVFQRSTDHDQRSSHHHGHPQNKEQLIHSLNFSKISS